MTPMTVGGVCRRLMRTCVPTIFGSPLNFPLPQLVPEDDDVARGKRRFRVLERPAEQRLQAEHLEEISLTNIPSSDSLPSSETMKLNDQR